MTQQEYEQKLDAALGELDWHDPRSKESQCTQGAGRSLGGQEPEPGRVDAAV